MDGFGGEQEIMDILLAFVASIAAVAMILGGVAVLCLLISYCVYDWGDDDECN